jgi:hypothetical protein
MGVNDVNGGDYVESILYWAYLSCVLIDNFRDFKPQSQFSLVWFYFEIVVGKMILFGEVNAAENKGT